MKSRRKKILEGKLPLEVLKPILDSIPRGDLLAPSTRIGMDASIIRSRGKYAVLASGSCRGSERNLVSRLVIELSEKLKSVGAIPRIIDPIMLFPPGASVKEIRSIVSEMIAISSRLDITIAKGHTEITPWLDKLTIIITMIGSSDRPPTVVNEK